MKLTDKQITYMSELCHEAGYTGDRLRNASLDLLGDGDAWRDYDSATRLVGALLRKVGREPSPASPSLPKTARGAQRYSSNDYGCENRPADDER